MARSKNVGRRVALLAVLLGAVAPTGAGRLWLDTMAQ